MSTIFVTGGAGFIGSHTCLLLLQKGYKLVILDSLINSSKISLERVSEIVFQKYNSERIKFINGDIRNNDLLESIFNDAALNREEFEGVIHFAGLKAVGESVSYPLKYWDANVNGSITLLKVMDKYNCRTIVFSSSATVYGEPNYLPIDESHRIEAINPYGSLHSVVQT